MIKELTKAFLSILIPDRCLLCETTLFEGENKICLNCMAMLPAIECHAPFTNNVLTDRLLSHRAPVERAASFMRYERGGISARLIHEIKYNSRPSAAHSILDRHIPSIRSEGFFNGIDFIIPVPQHWTRLLKRGYSQTLEISKIISSLTQIPVARNLVAPYRHSSQTHLTQEERLANVSGTFRVRDPQELEGKHVLLVDDVLTTGATLYAAMSTLKKSAPTIRISIYTLSVTPS